jgi:hypothetical protein
VNILGKYCDALEVTISGRPKMAAFKWLEDERRALRQSAHLLRDVGAVPDVPGGPLMLTRKGGGGYHFVLQSAAIKRLELSGWRRSSQVMVQFRATTLHEHDLTEIAPIVDKIASHFLEGSFEVLVRRVDLALDVQFPDGKMPERQDIITRLEGRTYDEGPERITGMKFGSDEGPLQVLIYNKTRQIRVHGEGWIKADWATRATYDQGLDVHRIEIRLFRDALRKFKCEDPLTGQLRGIETVSDLFLSTGDLLQDVLGRDGGKGSKFRIASPDTRHLKRDRRKSGPQGERIRRAFLEDALHAGRIRTHTPSSSPSLKSARSTAVTFAVLAAAWECVLHGHPPKPVEEYLAPSLLQELPQWLKRKGHGSWREAVVLQAKTLLSSGQAP